MVLSAEPVGGWNTVKGCCCCCSCCCCCCSLAVSRCWACEEASGCAGCIACSWDEESIGSWCDWLVEGSCCSTPVDAEPSGSIGVKKFVLLGWTTNCGAESGSWVFTREHGSDDPVCEPPLIGLAETSGALSNWSFIASTRRARDRKVRKGQRLIPNNWNYVISKNDTITAANTLNNSHADTKLLGGIGNR